MKKDCKTRSLLAPGIWYQMRKILVVMKLSLLILLFSLFSAGASVFSQSNKFNLNYKDATVKEILGAIEDQSEFRFAFSSEYLDLDRKVSICDESQSITKILNGIFQGTDVKYTISDRMVILSVGTKGGVGLVQQKSISGYVTDSSGSPLPGVTVVVKGTTNGTITDGEGNYSLSNILENSILQFSFVGMRTQDIDIAGRTTVNIVLQESTVGIEEVVAVGYGTQKKVNLTGSISSVNSDFLESRPLTNSTQALQGVNGLYVNQAGGEPGADNATIRIRGIGTLNNNDPLVLVDGIEYNMKDVNSNDIESISVLKDAASASIYGNRAANGVILITTKKGKSGKLKAELNSYFGWQRATYLPDMVTNSVDYMLARNQASVNENQTKPYSDTQIEEYRNGTDSDLYPNTDWYDIMFSVAPMQDHFFRLSGGSDEVTFSMSVGYMDQTGVLMATDAKKYSLNSNVIFKPSDKFEFGIIINGSYWEKNGPYKGIGGNDDSAIGAIARALPIHPNILADGHYGDTWLVTPGHNVFRHPVARALEGGKKNLDQHAMVNIYAEYTFPLDIKYKATFAVNKSDNNEHTFSPETFLYTPKAPTVARPNGKDVRSVSETNSRELNTSYFQTLKWNKRISDQHDINLLFGFSRESFFDSNLMAYIEGFLGNELPELNAGTINKNVGGTSYESKLMSYFGRANYSFSDKYLFEFNFRYDGSSRFAKNNRWGFFPSFSVGWRINQESFMQNLQAVSNLKLRASWGQLGNQDIPLYSYLNNIDINQGATYNDAVVPGSAVTTLSDPNISWETTTIKNIGLDAGLWDNKLEVTIDVFDKVTTDILARINVPGQVGNLTGPITNLYGMSNKGFEISASHRNSIGDLNYNFGGSIAFVNNNVDFLNGNVQYTTNLWGNINVIEEGYPVNSWFLYKANGIFQSEEEVSNHAYQDPTTGPGDIIYHDFNNDNKIDVKDMRVLGRSTPKYTYSFNLNFDYKGFDLGAFFQGVQGIDIYPTSNVSWPLYNGAGLTKDQLDNSWTSENPDAKYPRLSLQKRGSRINARNSTFWLKDASYLRLKNLQIGYTIPLKLLTNIHLSKLRIYANAQNLLTFSKFKLSDPEKDILAEDIYSYPTTKIISVGCNVVF
ncbi:TonB-dependent receptor [Sunxiuqinia indica]|uniref:TonB-dependent receptor n=1 Tax=Sunxiuqinia indica TaxID=2692584 RepID=UPI001357285B|nr:TonB-dependent receptor [Sunxiuqinia indica]